MRKMHFNQQQQQQQQQQQPHHDFIQTPDKAPSLSSNANIREITTTPQHHNHHHYTSDVGKFAGGSEASCTSSTDSGVNISDNETTPPSPLSPQNKIDPVAASKTSPPSSITKTTTTTTTLKPYREQLHQNNNTYHTNVSNDNEANDYNSKLCSWNSVGGGGGGEGRSCSTFDNKLKSENQLKNGSNENNYRASYQSNRNAIKIENVIKNSHSAAMEEKVPASASTSTTALAAAAVAASELPETFNDLPCAPSPTPSSIISSSSSDTSQNLHPPSHHYHHNNRSPAVSIRSIDSSIIDSDSDSDANGDLEGVHENYVIKKLGTQVSYPPNHPDVPLINKGLTVVNQQITPNGVGPPPASHLAVLSNLGDNLGRIHSTALAAPCPMPNRPQVAISSSTDVTIGDKHFYEGPVTIQQFLIDSRDKWNESNGKDNVTFVDDNGDTRKNAKDLNSSTAASTTKYKKFVKRKKYMIAGACAVIALVVLAIVFGIEASNGKKNSIFGSIGDAFVDDGCIEGQLCIIERDIWRAHPQKQKLDPNTLPLQRVMIAHTATEPCDSLRTCSERVRVIQEYHMNSVHWDDIGYNFLISSDGRVYVGRGWDDVGAVVKGYNYNSVGIAFIGTFMTVKPTEAQLNACRLLIEEGVKLGKLNPNYNLNGARQFSATESPGDALYNIIRKWPHWSKT